MTELKDSIVSKDGKRLLTVEECPQISTWGMYDETVAEAPVFIGRSQIETGFIGAFTVINLHAVHHVTTSCAIECQSIGRFCMIAHNVHVGFPAHPADFLTSSFVFRYDDRSDFLHDYMRIEGDESEKAMREKYLGAIRKPLSVIGNDVWIGYGATILNDVNIGDGAIIAAGAVVSKDVEPYSIVGGNPAKTIRKRFDDATIEKLEELKWWEYGPDIMHGIDISDAERSIDELGERISSGKYAKFSSEKVVIDNRTGEITIRGDR